MRIKDIPIYLDLFMLPLPVILKRVAHRLMPKGKASNLPDLPDVKYTGQGLFPQKMLKASEFNTTKWKIVLGHYLQDELNFLGSGWTSIRNGGITSQQIFSLKPRPDLGINQPDWNRDQRSGFQFNSMGIPEVELQHALETDKVDVKFSWEFARMHHWPQLAIGAHIFPELKDKCLEKFEMQLKSFNDQCIYDRGIQWSSPMEVSIRLVNMLVAYELFSFFKPNCEDRFLNVAFEHWHFVKHNLESKSGYGTNHYLSNLMGLIVSGVYLDNDEIQRTQEWAVKEFEVELSKQFFMDGVNFEYSTYYHRLSTEISVISALAALRSGLRLELGSWKIIGKALSVLDIIKKPNDFLPQFGDNDSGRVLDIDPAGTLRAEFFPEPDRSSFCTTELYNPGIYHWLYQDVVESLPELQITSAEKNVSFDLSGLKFTEEWTIPYSSIHLEDIKRHDFNSGGLFVFKSNCFYLSINLMASKNGHRYRGHMHNDKASFELWVNGEDLIQDPGINSYSASTEERNMYRSTAVHPVPFTGREQNRFIKNNIGLFHMTLDVVCEVLHLSNHKFICSVKYGNVIHIRIFEIFSDNLRIIDFCNRNFSVCKDPGAIQTSGYGKCV